MLKERSGAGKKRKKKDIPSPFGKNISFLSELATEKRKHVPNPIKTKVYERARHMCENPKCPDGKSLKMEEGKFHHLSDPKKPVRLLSRIEFLCPPCHNKYGHKIKIKTIRNPFDVIVGREEHIIRVSLRKKASKK